MRNRLLALMAPTAAALLAAACGSSSPLALPSMRKMMPAFVPENGSLDVAPHIEKIVGVDMFVVLPRADTERRVALGPTRRERLPAAGTR